MQLKLEIGAGAVCAVLLSLWIFSPGGSESRPDRAISIMAVSRTGTWLAAGTAHGTIAIWNVQSGGPARRIAFLHGSLNDLAFSPDEHTIAIGSGDLALYALALPGAPRILRSDRRNYGSVQFSRDGQNLLVITGQGLIEEIDARSGALRFQACCSSVYGTVAFTPDEQAIANAGHWPGLWDASSGRLLGRWTRNREYPTFRPIAFDAGRGTILMGSQDGRVYVWDLKTRALTARSAAQPDYVDTLAVSSTGWVAFAGFGRTVRIWNPEMGRQHLLADARPSSNLVFGSDGATIIFGNADGEIEFWDLGTERCIRRFCAATGSVSKNCRCGSRQ